MSSLPPRSVQLLDYAFIPRSRPGLVTTIGVLSIIFGSLGILSHGCGTIYSTLFFVAAPAPGAAVPTAAATEVFNRFAVGLAVVGCLYPLALIFVLRTRSVQAYYSTGAAG